MGHPKTAGSPVLNSCGNTLAGSSSNSTLAIGIQHFSLANPDLSDTVLMKQALV
jgi:hypothetical protein